MDKNFFTKKVQRGNVDNSQNNSSEQSANVNAKTNYQTVNIDGELINKMQQVYGLLKKLGMTEFANDISKVYNDASKQLFSVSVVGEFSKGKSTFINNLLGKEILPVGVLPTTSMLTRVRYNAQEIIMLFDEYGRKVKALPLVEESWEGLIADNFSGNNLKGFLLVGVNNANLKDKPLEIVDTPGAGDLDEERTKRIGQALMSSDGAIITISALAPLSISEHDFIEQRLIAKKTPYLMLIVTHLDEIPFGERNQAIAFIKDKLQEWGYDIPVYIPGDIEVDNPKLLPYIGIDKIHRQIDQWLMDPERKIATENWLKARVDFVLEGAVASLESKLGFLAEQDLEKRKQLVLEKRKQLEQVRKIWLGIVDAWDNKGAQCCKNIEALLQEKEEELVENYLFRIQKCSDLKTWWEEDFSFNFKKDLGAILRAVDGECKRSLVQDINALNMELKKTMNAVTTFDLNQINKDDFFNKGKNADNKDVNIELEDINKQREREQAGISVGGGLIALGSFLATGGLALPVMALAPIGMFISKMRFEGKLEEQRKHIGTVVKEFIHTTILTATEEACGYINTIYDDVINKADKCERNWYDNFQKSMDALEKPVTTEEQVQLQNMVVELTKCKDFFR